MANGAVGDGKVHLLTGPGLHDADGFMINAHESTIPERLSYTKKYFADVWVGIFDFLALYAKNSRVLELQIDDSDGPWKWMSAEGGPIHTSTWAFQIRIIKAITRLKGIKTLRFRSCFAKPIQEYIRAKFGIELELAPEGMSETVPWHLETLVRRVKKEMMVLGLPKKERTKALSRGDGVSEQVTRGDNLEIDPGCGYYYWSFEDVQEAVEFQKELDEMGIKDFADIGSPPSFEAGLER